MGDLTARVLVVDDQPQVAEMICREVSATGLECAACYDPTQVMRLAVEGGFEAVVTDITMPDLSGMDLLAQLRKRAPECKVILITAHTSRDYLAQALMLGAFDYVEKPFDPAEVAEVVRQAIDGNDEIAPLPARAAASMEPGFHTRRAALDSIGALVRAVEAKDPYTHRHSQQVSHYTTKLARVLGVSGKELESVHVASLLHDVGKIGVPDAILTKPGHLTAEEFEHVRRHPALGEAILAKITVFTQEAALIRHHHERWDGSGYPDGLSGEKTPRLSRLICVADCMDAMLMTRSYKDAYPIERMLDELTDNAGTQFDPEIARAAVEWCQTNVEDLVLSDNAVYDVRMSVI